MTKLGCDVSTCAYNQERLCCRNSILVDGRKALQSTQTSCSSFAAKDHAMNNSSACNFAESATDVSCKASRCIFNADGICSAQEIKISACCCSEPDCAGETACESFRRSK